MVATIHTSIHGRCEDCDWTGKPRVKREHVTLDVNDHNSDFHPEVPPITPRKRGPRVAKQASK